MGLEPHPDKTWVGSAERGVEFLGYRINQTGLTVATATVQHAMTRLHRLDEQQGRDLRQTAALGDYVSRWWRWAGGGLPDLQPCVTPLPSHIVHERQQAEARSRNTTGSDLVPCIGRNGDLGSRSCNQT
jgi:hypothetical protein